MQGQQLGEIDGLLLDPTTGTVQYAVVEAEGQRECPIPWSAFKVTRHPTGKILLMLDATPEKLAKAPSYSMANPNELFTPEGSNTVHSYWQSGSGATVGREMPPAPVAEGPVSSRPPGESSGQLQNYYDVNRDILEPSAEPQNNSPEGIEPEPQKNPSSSLPDQSIRAYDQVTDKDAPPEAPSDSAAPKAPQSGKTIPE